MRGEKAHFARRNNIFNGVKAGTIEMPSIFSILHKPDHTVKVSNKKNSLLLSKDYHTRYTAKQVLSVVVTLKKKVYNSAIPVLKCEKGKGQDWYTSYDMNIKTALIMISHLRSKCDDKEKYNSDSDIWIMTWTWKQLNFYYINETWTWKDIAMKYTYCTSKAKQSHRNHSHNHSPYEDMRNVIPLTFAG